MPFLKTDRHKETGFVQDAMSPQSKVKEKEKKTRLSLLLTKSGSHENVNPESKNPTKSITPAAALKWRESFEEMLDHKDGLETFTTFLKTEFSEENIEFWLDCEEYKKIKSPTELVSKAKKMYAVYIDTEAPKEINIDFSTKTAIKQNILKPTHSCFEAAQSKVYSLMKKDCYPRFLKSDMYFNLTKTLPPPSMSRRRSRSCVFNDRSEAETELGIWL
ncbi:regulator of G-protein signaling 18 isoform X2 [Amia ocellicauda]|uniref:regulator of G-protein signaling 18 isoform X2 n=1 Tax=Amia ocellicauda TaxID=2972642 RepID=UPI0034638718